MEAPAAAKADRTPGQDGGWTIGRSRPGPAGKVRPPLFSYRPNEVRPARPGLGGVTWFIGINSPHHIYDDFIEPKGRWRSRLHHDTHSPHVVRVVLPVDIACLIGESKLTSADCGGNP
jgi:hypothetical protein